MTLPPGRFRFDVIRKIGEGGLGLVEEILITESNATHPVGLRLARKRLGVQWASQPEARARFDREIHALRQMKHPNIITVQGEDIGQGERFYCMPLCETSYRPILMANPSGFVWPQVARFGIIVARALEHAHSIGHFHRDLKPENILLDKLGNIYICDWGIGYFVHKQSTVLTKLTIAGGMGTEYYCSLEQWIGQKATAHMDVYALGIMLAELTMGRQIRPFTVGTGVRIDVTLLKTTGAQMFNTAIRNMTQMLSSARTADMTAVIAELSAAVAMDDLENLLGAI